MTATEVLQRIEEMSRLLGPMVGRVFTEFLDQVVGRVFGILLRNGFFNRPPEALEGQDIKVVYLSPLARAQKISEARAALQGNEMMAGYLELFPQMADNLNPDAMYRDVTEAVGMPQRWLNDKEVVEQIRALRQQQQQAQEQAAMLKEGADTVANLKKAGFAGGEGT